MDPLLARKLDQTKRSLAFVPAAAVVTGIVFITIGLTTHSMVAALYLSPILGVAATWLLLGWPVIHLPGRRGEPLVSKRVKPYLFFPLFPLLSAALYPVIGLLLTPVVPPEYAAYASLGLAILTGASLAYLAVGFPPFIREARAAWAKIPPRTKPWLSLPGGAALSFAFYYAFGIALTQLPIPVEYATLGALALSLAAGFGLAVLLFGFPKPEKPLRETIPRVPAQARPLAFGLALLILTPAFAFALGPAVGMAGLPADADLYLTGALALLLAFGVAAATLGLPGRWRRMGYRPGISEPVRLALFLPVLVGVGLVATAVANVAGLLLEYAILVGVPVGLAAATLVSGIHRRVPRKDRTSFVPEVPDKVKPFLVIPAWALFGTLFFGVSRLLYATFLYNFLIGVVLGFAAAILVIEEPLVRSRLAARRREREVRRGMKTLRKERVEAFRRLEVKDARPAATAPVAASRPGLLQRLRPRK